MDDKLYKEEDESESRKRKEQWSIILLSLLGQMDTLKATCFQLQIIAAFGLQWSALNPSDHFFFPQHSSSHFALNNSIVFKTKLLPRVTLKNKN